VRDLSSFEVETTWIVRRGAWKIRTETRSVLTSGPKTFHLYASLDAYEDDRRIYSRNWDCLIPRKNV
jgi:hypothetical protein